MLALLNGETIQFHRNQNWQDDRRAVFIGILESNGKEPSFCGRAAKSGINLRVDLVGSASQGIGILVVEIRIEFLDRPHGGIRSVLTQAEISRSSDQQYGQTD